MAAVQSAAGESRGLSASRGRADRAAPVAVVDIGSNSVRLVIYESLSRAPAVVHNEKAICAIGRNMVTTRRLNEDGIVLALEELARFRMLADGLHVPIREAVATAAARDADNGQEFVRRAEAVWGGPIRVLSGEEEARIAADGVLAGMPDADGLVADLGGGSLDMVTVRNGKTGAAVTLPFGPLRLSDVSRGDIDKARDILKRQFGGLDKLGALDGQRLYAVGGAWRSLARMDMEDVKHPLHVLHAYTIPAARAIKKCRAISGLGKKSLSQMKIISRRRAEALPYGALVLEQLLLATGIGEVVISAFGLREGLLFSQLSAEERAKDPLIEFAAGVNARMARAPDHALEMFEWAAPLFAGESATQARIRRAASLFSDIAWRRHPDNRAMGAFDQVLNAPFAGATHPERALIAASVLHRYTGDEDFPRELAEHNLLNEEDDRTARKFGIAARLAFALSASAAGELKHYKLRVTPTRVLLDVARRREAIAGEQVQKRLGELAAAMDRKGEILIG